jgi:hypothetical protein
LISELSSLETGGDMAGSIKTGFPVDLAHTSARNYSKSLTVSQIIGYSVMVWMFWNITLVVGIIAGKSMMNSLTGIDSLIGTPARMFLQFVVS